MKDKAISEAIYNALIHQNLAHYQQSLRNQDMSDAGTAYDALRKIFNTLDGNQQSAMMNLLKIVIIDTASTILGAIDGTTFLAGADGDYALIYEGAEIQGCLQDYFLAKAEAEDSIRF